MSSTDEFEDVLNTEYLAWLIRNDDDPEGGYTRSKKIVADLIAGVEECLRGMADALAQQRLEVCRSYADRLDRLCATFGIRHVSYRCLVLRILSHLRDEENEDFISPEEALDKSRKTLREIEAQWAEAKAAIEKYCAEEMERRNALFKA